MADISVTAADVRPVFQGQAEIYDFVAAVAIDAGEAVYLTTAGTVGLADANAAGQQQAIGIALKSVSAGEAVSVLKKGHLYGFDLSGMNPGAFAFLSDTAGALADAASVTLTVPMGRVLVLSDKPNYTKVLYIEATWFEAHA